ncbi:MULTISPECIES: hypothetical protein [Lactobacillus]|jgi:type IV secretory pathway component VirB8|uniref:hypothetical protein n=1 Tax=Lactobacillus TaxID=1578 RepID=UPI000704BA1C|nr:MULTISPECIES: hypothetical protein [Lactobacillus]MCI6882642.1 hypothetical protein [Lactobacillus johnsonii]MCI7590852.1 hypothetical protein [Lactobacillus johnsonii]MCT3600640.1 hypothetical protein [Lactobacillus amylovorus]MDB6230760.1 hypothetical protein [Lactobacillus amylovorus]MDY4500512.1 hypothetical protein [Lactobacillus johnsonii]
MKASNNKNETMVEKHALDRLNKVEEDRQSVYKKKNNGLNFNKIVMFIVFALVLAITIFSMLK